MRGFLVVLAAACVIAIVSAQDLSTADLTVSGAWTVSAAVVATGIPNAKVVCAFLTSAPGIPPATEADITSSPVFVESAAPITTSSDTVSLDIPPGTFTNVYCTLAGSDNVISATGTPLVVTAGTIEDSASGSHEGGLQASVARSPAADFPLGSVSSCVAVAPGEAVASIDFDAGAQSAEVVGSTAPLLVAHIKDLKGSTAYKVACVYKNTLTGYLSDVFTVSESLTTDPTELVFPTAPDVTNDAVTITVGRWDSLALTTTESGAACLVRPTSADAAPSLADVWGTPSTSNTGGIQQVTVDPLMGTNTTLSYTALFAGTYQVFCSFTQANAGAVASTTFTVAVYDLATPTTEVASGSLTATFALSGGGSFLPVHNPATCAVVAATGNALSQSDVIALPTTAAASGGYRTELANPSGTSGSVTFSGLNGGNYDVHCTYTDPAAAVMSALDVAVAPLVEMKDPIMAVGGRESITVTVEPATGNFLAAHDEATCGAIAAGSPALDRAGLMGLTTTPTATGYRVVVDLPTTDASAMLSLPGLQAGDYDVYCAFADTATAVRTFAGVSVKDVLLVDAMPNGKGRILVTLSPKTLSGFPADFGPVTCVAAKTAPATPFTNDVGDANSIWLQGTDINSAGYRMALTPPAGDASVELEFHALEAVDTWLVYCAEQPGNGTVTTYGPYTVDQMADPTAITPGATTATSAEATVDLSEGAGLLACAISRTAIADAAALWALPTSDTVKHLTAGGTSQSVSFTLTTGADDYKVYCAYENSALVASGDVDVPCAAGYGDDGAHLCAACAVGQFATGDATTFEACTSCGSNSTTMSTGSTASTDCGCPAGYTWNADANSCTPCAADEYSDFNAACTACPADKTSTPGSATCKCKPGYKVNGGSCTACAEDTYSAEADASDCMACGANAWSEAGAAICNCDLGYGRNVTSGECEACMINEYSLDSMCTPCPHDKYSPAGSGVCCPIGQGVNGTECAVCPAGQYGDGGVCTACPDGKSSAEGATAVTECCVANSAWIASAAACVCRAGYEATGAGACAQCAAGKYKKTETVVSACAACADDTFAPVAGWSLDCVKCPSNTFSGAHIDLGTATCYCNTTGTFVAFSSDANSTCPYPKIVIPSGASPTAATSVMALLAVLLAMLALAF